MTPNIIAIEFETLITIPTHTLGCVNGGWSREDSQNLGGQTAEAAALVGGTGLGALGGTPLSAMAGTAAGEALNRTGLSNQFGRWAGGKIDDGVRAVNRSVGEMSQGLQTLYGKQ